MPVQRDANVAAEQGSFVLKLTDEGLAHPIFTGVTNAWDRIPPVLSLCAPMNHSPSMGVL